MDDLYALYASCTLCPRQCGADRSHGKKGRCGATCDAYAARAALHSGEEPCISGTRGSGTVFFSHCPLGCIFCQNHEISADGIGRSLTATQLSTVFFRLQEQGAHNITLVTATHYLPTVADALRHAKAAGLYIPIVYNTGGYEMLETLRLLEGLVDVYLPDLKFYDSALSVRYAQAADYFPVAAAAVSEMLRQTGPPVFDGEGMMRRGVLIRHLLLPGKLFDSKKIVDFVHSSYGDAVWLSLMNQYTPMPTAAGYPELCRPVPPRHYEALVDYAASLGMEQVYIQQEPACGREYIPRFDGTGL